MSDKQLYTLCGVILLTGGAIADSAPLNILGVIYILVSAAENKSRNHHSSYPTPTPEPPTDD